MITAVHTLIYSDDAAATRAFLRDVVGWPSVEDGDSGSGWLIFQTGRSELGVHPTSGGSGEHAYQVPRHHYVSLICDDLDATRAELVARGASVGEPQQMGFGRGVLLDVPGADQMLVYEPSHATAYDLP